MGGSTRAPTRSRGAQLPCLRAALCSRTCCTPIEGSACPFHRQVNDKARTIPTLPPCTQGMVIAYAREARACAMQYRRISLYSVEDFFVIRVRQPLTPLVHQYMDN